MRQTKFTIDQIIKILAEADLPGSSVSQVARKYNALLILFIAEDKNIKASSLQKLNTLKSLKKKILNLKNSSLKKNFKSKSSLKL